MIHSIKDIKRLLKLTFPKSYIWHSTRIFRRHARMNDAEKKDEIQRLYKHYLGRDLNWTSLTRYSEKMQWKKLYYINPFEKIASDKYAVRQFVAEKIGEEYLIPLIGVWDKFEDIDFDSLPEQFVLKTTHSSSNNIIIRDKKSFDKEFSALMFRLWLSVDYAYASFEMNYKDIPRRIIAEKYMQDSKGELPDYKFMCFDGKPYCCWVDEGRFTNHTRDIFDMNWTLLPFTDRFPNSGNPISRPQNFDKMIEIVSTLSEGFSHVRVDLYNIDGNIYFGELTFCESSGFCKFEPDDYDVLLGSLWNLPIE